MQNETEQPHAFRSDTQPTLLSWNEVDALTSILDGQYGPNPVPLQYQRGQAWRIKTRFSPAEVREFSGWFSEGVDVGIDALVFEALTLQKGDVLDEDIVERTRVVRSIQQWLGGAAESGAGMQVIPITSAADEADPVFIPK
jgi:hypothetical protein